MVIRSDNVTFKHGDSVSGEVSVKSEAAKALTMEELDGGTTVLEVQLAANRKARYPDKGKGSFVATGSLAHRVQVASLLVQGRLMEMERRKGGYLEDFAYLKDRLGDIIALSILLIDELNDSAEDVVNEAVTRL